MSLVSVGRHNAEVWNQRVRAGLSHTEGASDADFAHPMTVIDQCGWLGGDVRGKRVLCLAAGGGKHGPLFASAGAEVTVLDISSAMLAQDRAVAERRKLNLRTVEGSMDDLTMFPNCAFDIVIQPVSSCYIPDLRPMYQELARVTAPRGLYISQHKQPAALQAEAGPEVKGYLLTLPYTLKGPLPPAPPGSMHRESGAIEFLHTWEELIGSLCRSGFVLEDLIEPRHANPSAPPGTFSHRCGFLPPFVTFKARRIDQG